MNSQIGALVSLHQETSFQNGQWLMKRLTICQHSENKSVLSTSQPHSIRAEGLSLINGRKKYKSQQLGKSVMKQCLWMWHNNCTYELCVAVVICLRLYLATFQHAKMRAHEAVPLTEGLWVINGCWGWCHFLQWCSHF